MYNGIFMLNSAEYETLNAHKSPYGNGDNVNWRSSDVNWCNAHLRVMKPFIFGICSV